jgi:hypothetical protein
MTMPTQHARTTATLAATALMLALAAGGPGLVAQPRPAAPPSPHRVAFDAWLDTQAYDALAKRRKAVASLTTAEAVKQRQATVATILGRAVQPFPLTDAPLNARITRTQRRDGYRIEHVLFESLPGYRVTALAYVPDGAGPFPAVLGTAGHSVEGKAHTLYQHAWISMARRGFLVLAYDPPGQGERLEYYDADTKSSSVGVGVPEHVMTGQQLLLTGSTLAAYMVQDGRRAIDYLLTRGDVDAARLAVAGNSGGGTQAALLAAFEPRLAAIVASCYMTSWQQLWRGPGPQDAEQIVPGLLSSQLDFADFAIAAAPRGFLVSSAIRDYFPIEGARACHAELRRLYGVLGAADRVAMVENDATHGWSQPLREGAYRWLRSWLAAPDAPAAEAALTPDDPATLHVTATGQLATSDGSRTTRALNLERARALASERPAATVDGLRAIVQLDDRRTAARVVERVATDGGRRERLIIEVEPGVRLTGTLMRPAAAATSAAAALVIDDRGTHASAEADALAAAGHTVLALDVRGTGDLGPVKGESGYAATYQFAARAWLLGTSVVAWQVRDVLAGLEVLRAEAPGAATRAVHARGLTTPAALWAAQVDRPDTLVLEDGLVSYLDLAAADRYEDASLMVVPGVLTVTDLPELMARAAPARIVLRTPRRPDGTVVAAGALDGLLGGTRPAHVHLAQ